MVLESVLTFVILLLVFITLLHSERPKLYTILAFLSAVRLKGNKRPCHSDFCDLTASVFNPTALRKAKIVYNFVFLSAIWLKGNKRPCHSDFCDLTASVFNPIALRKAKIVYNFGLSECSMVKGK